MMAAKFTMLNFSSMASDKKKACKICHHLVKLQVDDWSLVADFYVN